MDPLLRLLGAAMAHGLLTGQVLFSLAFVGSCELPNWLSGAGQVNACLERWMTVSALFFPSGVASRGGSGADGHSAGGSGGSGLLPRRRGLLG